MNVKRQFVLNADQLRKLNLQGDVPSGLSLRVEDLEARRKKIKKNEIYIVLDNVLDTYNVGSIFRLADAVAAKKIYLCGETETPPNHRIKKASINTTEWVTWSYKETAMEALQELKTQNSKLKIIAIEQSTKSVPYDQFEYKLPICLVVGHESEGVSPEVLKMADKVVELPMFGVNKSLNVMVSLGIVLYQVISKLKTQSSNLQLKS